MSAWIVVLVLLGAQPTQAEVDEELSGSYRFAGGPQERLQITTVIDRTVGLFNFALRPFARRTLERACSVPPRVLVRVEGGSISIAASPYPARATRLDGTPLRFRNQEGSQVVMFRRVDGDNVVETSTISRSRRIVVYQFSPDRLAMDLRIESRHLPQPVRYSLTYER